MVKLAQPNEDIQKNFYSDQECKISKIFCIFANKEISKKIYICSNLAQPGPTN